MSLPTPPSNLPIWIPSNNPAYIETPPTGQTDTGWVELEAPPFTYMNWWMNLVYQWVVYLNAVLTGTTASTVPANSTVLSTTGNITNGSNQMVVGVATGILKGQAIVATGVPTGTFVDSITSLTVTMSQNASATTTGVAVAFNHQYATGNNVQAQLDELDATIFTREYPYDIIIGGSTIAAATHATLAAALADANYGANQRVLLADSQTIGTTITISKSGWRISALPSVTYTNSSAGTGISVNAAGNWVDGLRMSGFTTGIAYTSLGTYGRVANCNFASCTLDYDDTSAPAGKKPSIYGSITE